MPKSADEILYDKWPQTDEELGSEVPVDEQSNIYQLVKPKRKPSENSTEKQNDQPEISGDNENKTVEEQTNSEKEEKWNRQGSGNRRFHRRPDR